AAEAAQLTYGLAPVVFAFPGAAEAIAVNETYVENSGPDPCAGLFSDAATKAQPQLDELYETYIHQIIVGNRPMSDLEVYREQWRSRGGDAMRTEFQEALKARENGERSHVRASRDSISCGRAAPSPSAARTATAAPGGAAGAQRRGSTPPPGPPGSCPRAG